MAAGIRAVFSFITNGVNERTDFDGLAGNLSALPYAERAHIILPPWILSSPQLRAY